MNLPKTRWLLPIRRLERALAAPVTGRERPWAARLAAATEALIEILRAHAEDSEAADGLFTEVDLTRPSYARQVGHLRQEHADLLALASQLHAEALGAAEAFTFRASPPEKARAGGVPDFGRLRQRAEELVRAVGRHQEEETSLVLDSVTTDIGVGD